MKKGVDTAGGMMHCVYTMNDATRTAHPVNPRNPKASPKQQTGRNAWWHADFASERRRLMAGSGDNGKHAAIARGRANAC